MYINNEQWGCVYAHVCKSVYGIITEMFGVAVVTFIF